MQRNLALGLGLVLAGAAAAYVGYRSMQPARPRPNVLIVLWDTVRADRLNAYGYDKPTSPKLAAWAEQSAVVFERAISPAMWTVPSHASLFTGLMPSTHNAAYDWRWLDNANVTLAEWFNQHGYDTYAFSANPNLSTGRVNLLQGFKAVDQSWGRKWAGKVAQNARKKLIKADKSTEISPSYRGGATSTFSYNAGPVTQEAFLGWLNRRADDAPPWFAYLNFMEAHKPRVPSLNSRRRLGDDELIKVGLATDLTMKSQLEYSYGKKAYTERELEAINLVYDASLADLDDTTAELFQALDSRGHLDNTIVVFTSDHGENLGEHQLFGHRHGVYQQLVAVPLILSYPGVVEPGRVNNPVAVLDVYNTLLTLTGLPRPEKPISTGNLLASRPLQAVFTESISIDVLGFEKVQKWFPDSFPTDPLGKKFKAVVQGDWKLITATDGSELLYNLAQDPGELTNLAQQEPAKLAELKGLIEEFKRTTPAYDPAIREEGEGPREDSDALKKQLELLGYATGDEEAEAPAASGGEGAPRRRRSGGGGQPPAGAEGDEEPEFPQ